MTKLTVNGKECEVQIKPHESLADVLRDQLDLFGVRVSCNEGECGSCTVIMDGKPVTACIVLGMQAEGKEILTIEGIGTVDNLHPIQQAYIEEQGFQCAFCTPGFIMATKDFLEENPDPTEEEAAIGISGNICRCGAYPYIVKSVLNAAKKLQEQQNTE